MKNLINGLALISMLSIFSCTKIIYTQQQVLARYQTRDDVTKNFGIPTERKTGQTLDAWLYTYDPNYGSVEQHVNTATTDVTEFGHYKRYVVFIFDKEGNVVKSDVRGVKMAVKKFSAGKTVALVGGIAATATILIIVALYLFPITGPFDHTWGD